MRFHNIMITMVFVLFIVGFVLFAFASTYPMYKDCKEAGIKFSDCGGESICKTECNKLNMEFFKYEFHSSFLGSGNEECRCINESKPYQIY